MDEMRKREGKKIVFMECLKGKWTECESKGSCFAPGAAVANECDQRAGAPVDAKEGLRRRPRSVHSDGLFVRRIGVKNPQFHWGS